MAENEVQTTPCPTVSVGGSTVNGIFTLDGNVVIRRNAPTTLFGGNCAWLDMQEQMFRSGAIRSEIINWMQHFPGFLYRYPGGTESNNFDWRGAIGSPRLNQYYGYGKYGVSDFGIDEFYAFLEAVNGKGIFVANAIGPFTSWSADQGDYPRGEGPSAGLGDAGAAAELKALADYLATLQGGSITSKSRIQHFELGNETDNPGTVWTSAKTWTGEIYGRRCNAILSAVAPYHPALKFITHLNTRPTDTVFFPMENKYFSLRLNQTLNRLPYASAIHAYFDGYNIPAWNVEATKEWNWFGKARRRFITEYNKWPSGNLGLVNYGASGMSSAFRGEYDALQRYIPSITDAAIKQAAMAATGKTNEKSLTEQEKAEEAAQTSSAA